MNCRTWRRTVALTPMDREAFDALLNEVRERRTAGTPSDTEHMATGRAQHVGRVDVGIEPGFCST